MTSHRKGVKNPTPILNLHTPLSAPRLSSKYMTNGELEYVEIKGVRTRDWLLKWKLFPPI